MIFVSLKISGDPVLTTPFGEKYCVGVVLPGGRCKRQEIEVWLLYSSNIKE